MSDYDYTSPNLPNAHQAVGSWLRDPLRRLLDEQMHAKQRALLTDQLLMGGIRSDLFRAVESGEKCKCYKESNQQSDKKCKACHGVGLVPGYLKFGYSTVWMSVSDTDLTTSGVEITTDFKSAKMQLTSTSTTGTIESGDKPFSRTAIGSTWEYNEISFVRIAASSSVTVEYSLDSGITWNALSSLPTANPASGVIRFRVTLTRASTAILSPLFEIIRARYSTLDLAQLQTTGQFDGTYRFGPWILILRSIPRKRHGKKEYGDVPVQEGLTFWTAGLSLFDSSIDFGSTDELIKFNEGFNDVLEIKDGIMSGKRYVVVQRMHSDPAGYSAVVQDFVIRVADPVGPYNLIW